MTRTITTDWLRECEACPGQIAIVEAEWGESVELTRANLRRAAELKLELSWLIAVLELSNDAQSVYAAAKASALADARRAYAAAKAEALADVLECEEEEARDG